MSRTLDYFNEVPRVSGDTSNAESSQLVGPSRGWRAASECCNAVAGER